MQPQAKRFLTSLCIAGLCWACAAANGDALIAAIPATAVCIGFLAVLLLRRADAPYSVFAAAQTVQAALWAVAAFLLMKDGSDDSYFVGALMLAFVLPVHAVILAATPVVYAIRHHKEGSDHGDVSE
jgi:hypothetical protein